MVWGSKCYYSQSNGLLLWQSWHVSNRLSLSNTRMRVIMVVHVQRSDPRRVVSLIAWWDWKAWKPQFYLLGPPPSGRIFWHERKSAASLIFQLLIPVRYIILYFETFLVLYWFIDQVSVWSSTFYLPMAGNLNPRIDPSIYYWWQCFLCKSVAPNHSQTTIFLHDRKAISKWRGSELWVELHS